MGIRYQQNEENETVTASNKNVRVSVDKKGVLRMSLRYFIERFIIHNTIVRLWKPCADNHGHEMLLTEDGKEVCMEWQILNGECHKKYADCHVMGVTDIVCERDMEAVNIVVDTE